MKVNTLDHYMSPADMDHSAVSVIPVNYDFAAHDFGDDWEEVEVLECDKCHVQIVTDFTNSNNPHSDYDNYEGDNSECDGTLTGSDGPMMNYYYPLPGINDVSEAYKAAEKIDGLNLCIIWFPMMEECAMALTGAGMDFSWEICEAYMRLGYVPPYHFASDMDSDANGMTEVREWVVAGCRESIDTMFTRAKNAKERLDNVEKVLLSRTKK